MPGKSFDDDYDAFQTARQRIRCATCLLPEEVRIWVEAKVKGGATRESVAQFLHSKGYILSSSAVANHMVNHVS